MQFAWTFYLFLALFLVLYCLGFALVALNVWFVDKYDQQFKKVLRIHFNKELNLYETYRHNINIWSGWWLIFIVWVLDLALTDGFGSAFMKLVGKDVAHMFMVLIIVAPVLCLLTIKISVLVLKIYLDKRKIKWKDLGFYDDFIAKHRKNVVITAKDDKIAQQNMRRFNLNVKLRVKIYNRQKNKTARAVVVLFTFCWIYTFFLKSMQFSDPNFRYHVNITINGLEVDPTALNDEEFYMYFFDVYLNHLNDLHVTQSKLGNHE